MWLATSALNLFERCHCGLAPTVSTKVTTYQNASNVDSYNASLCFNSSFSELTDPNCPNSSGRSMIAHAGLAVGSLATATHLALIFSLRSGLVRLYGPCLLTSMWSSFLHSLLLFASAQISSFVRQSENLSTEFSTQLLTCQLIDSLLHATALITHLSLLLGLFGQYQQIKRNEFYRTTFIRKDVTHRRNSRSMCIPLSNQVPVLPSVCTTPDYECKLSGYPKSVLNRHSTEELHRSTQPAQTMWTGRVMLPNYSTSRRHHCFPEGYCHADWSCMGPPLSVLLSLVPVSFGLYSTWTFELSSPWNLAYGIVNCGGVGSCLLAFQWLLYLPLGIVFVCESLLIAFVVTRPAYSQTVVFGTQSEINEHLHFKAQFGMHCKMVISQMVVWITAFISNHVCLTSLWQLYALFTGLQSLFLIVSCVLSRPFLEVIFKRNDPLRHLKLDNLAMNMPLAMRQIGGKPNLPHSAAVSSRMHLIQN
ncbi:hypothetical protein CSKR_101358 [Clonorchis sinensis]|uniref:Uncharacterized protein n=1 Tax=Clonorchis sinensis TaxID=79923 RepID=A0A3R7CPW7_CLOSI|nr:hypothetical protein CSKR_101358 [Clonorchis sinensis]